MSLYDWLAILLYLSVTIAIGLWMSRKQEDLDDYFLGGRTIPWWAALLSMVATETSAATFLGAPEQGYIRDMTYLQFSVGTIAARFVLASVFIAAFYRLRVFTVYGFLTARFGSPTQTTTASVFLLGRLFASGARLFIAAIAIEVATGLSMQWSIILLGIVAAAYTWFGGIKAVIWTDVLQAIVLVGGGTIALFSLLGDVPLTVGETVDFLSDHGKFRIFDFGDGGGWAILSNPYHVVPAVIGGFFLTMATHGTDHDMVQRLLTCRESREGQRSLWMSGLVSVLVTTLFLGVGQMLFVYVQHLPVGDPMGIAAATLAESGKNGHFFLYYIVSGLPAGVTGLVLAAVFAAAMSSLDSAMSAMSATFVTDIYRAHFRRDAGQRHYLLVGRLSTAVIGVLLVGVALLVVHYYEANPATDLLSIALGVMTFFYGALLGIFLIGFMTRDRGSSLTNVIGAAASILLVILVKQTTSVGWPWFIVIGTLVCFGVAFAGRTAAAVADRYAESG
ncbi:MAG: sodium/solute symporter [Candidatus Latescibacterota bacterium]